VQQRISLICFSMLCSGLSEVIGSWKIIAMRLPRMRAWFFPSGQQVLAGVRMLPDGCRASG
jgi:hypothetical protein